MADFVAPSSVLPATFDLLRSKYRIRLRELFEAMQSDPTPETWARVQVEIRAAGEEFRTAMDLERNVASTRVAW